jgi:hypothetical protein
VNHFQRAATQDAFFAGQTIDRTISAEEGTPPGAQSPIVVGRSLPYMYLPDREIRVLRMQDLRAAADGHNWVLVSPLSNWFWHDFLPPSEFDIPVQKIFKSDAPYIEVPRVESDAFERFTNEALHYKIQEKEIPFPVKNRLYRADDFFKACGPTG